MPSEQRIDVREVMVAGRAPPDDGSTLPATDLEEVMMCLRTFTRRTRRAVVIGGAVLAIAAPAASAQSTRCPAPPPSSIAAAAGEGYMTWRAACASDGTALTQSERVASLRAAYAINDRALPPGPKPVVTEAPTGFDWASAAIGATVVGGSLLLLGAAVGLRRYTAAETA